MKGQETKGARQFSWLDQVITLSRILPTIQLFDAVWQLTFQWMHTASPAACKYFRETYFEKVPPQNLQRQMRCTCALWEEKSLWFAGFWSGIIGTYPGTASGTQTLESFHAYWQTLISSQRPGPGQVLPVIEKLYENDWVKKFEWHEKREFATWPQSPGESLYNSATLRTAGRSTAVDFWRRREKRLCGQRNFAELWVRTDGAKASVDRSGLTRFWVMRATKVKDTMPANAVVDLNMAKRIANMIAAEGKELATALEQAGVVTGAADAKELNLTQLQIHFVEHCAVMEGHLPDTVWPRARTELQVRWPARVCACTTFALHADCEHVLFVNALQDDSIAQHMNTIPTVRKKGRKRKGATAVAENEQPKPKKLKKKDTGNIVQRSCHPGGRPIICHMQHEFSKQSQDQKRLA